MEFAVLRAIFVINAVLQQGGMGEGASLRSKKGICPPSYGCECSEIENYCTVGDDSTCADDLKCCFNGCEFDCLVPDPAPAPPPKKGDKGTGGGVASSRSKAGICPPHGDVECPDDIENFCTQGDDNTCEDDLKCCYTGCEYDCIVPDPVPDQPARKGDKGTGGGVASSRSKPGKCPPYEPAECPEDSEDYCTRGDDSTCVDDLKCCLTGCEYDCMVAVPAPAQPPGKGSAGNEGERAENGPPGPPGPPGSK